VEPGGAFVVDTPAGMVTVRGTSFRVEVKAMTKSMQVASGALLGALVVVGVYEGKVLFANDRGAVTLGAGEAAQAGADSAPTRGRALLASTMDAPPAAAPLPEPDVSRDELLVRDEVQRQEIRKLREKVRFLEGKAPPDEFDRAVDDDGNPWFRPSAERLKGFAKSCTVRMDIPPVFQTERFQLDAEDADAGGFEQDELSSLNAALPAFQADVQTRIRALYIEATGDVAGADTLSASAMRTEILDKGVPGERTALRKRVAEERAGLVPSPTPGQLAAASPMERFYRMLLGLGDEAEARLADVVGAGRARDLREKKGGWGNRWSSSGCPSDKEAWGASPSTR